MSLQNIFFLFDLVQSSTYTYSIGHLRKKGFIEFLERSISEKWKIYENVVIHFISS